MEVSKLYKVGPLDLRRNNNKKCGLLLGGNTVNITIYGKKTRPENLSQMVDLTNAEPFVIEGAFVLSALPQFIYFDGTADIIELINYVVLGELPLNGDLPMTATDLTGQGFSSETIDARLIYLSQIIPALTDITIYLFGNDDRTSASDAAVEILENNGCFIESDYTP